MSIYVVDAFTCEPFKGNPAAVCTSGAPLETGLMQKIAFEMNLSETAFPVSLADSGGGKARGMIPGTPARYDLRWFTPRVEVDLCGHATLASAHVLWETGRVESGTEIEFRTKSGVLRARPAGGSGAARGGETPGGGGKWIELDFPAEPPEACDPPEGLIESLGADPVYVGKTRFDYLLEAASEETVRGMRPDFDLLEKVPCRGVIVTAKGTDCDFVSRFFAPAVGIREDPVTGSAHCSLAPYWKERLGRDSFSARQVSARGGALKVRAEAGRAYISGQAVTVLEGRLVHCGEWREG